jgi:hypothetical protein
MTQRLPSLPNLGHLKKQAKDILRVSRQRSPSWRLADAQHALAHGYGFPSWLELKIHVESMRQQRGAGSSARRVQQDATADNVNAVAHAAVQVRQGRSSHPIAGTWATRRSPASGECAQAPMGDMVVELELIDGTVTLTQIVVDPAGRQSATKTAIQADGQDHPSQFGHELVLQARWTDVRTLELIFKHAETIVSKWTYEVSVDGQSLIVSTTDQVVIFERV